jgi:Stealth protein CR2, conserved region 2/Stealth protein CR1, conserved region 1
VLSKVSSRLGRLMPSLANAIGARYAIDAVIAWVDGRDRKHRAKRKRYLADPGGDAKPERAARDERRFSDNDEIRFCLRSIRNYAPWVRTIWLVTDDQVPAAIDRQRAELDNIRIVDHREIFRGYEQLLPTFNSLAIETMLWRIKGLADRFLYFNDDMMLVGPVEPTDFFSNDGKVNLRGWWCNWMERPDKRNSFHGSNKLLGAAMLGFTPEHFFSTHHVIYPLLRPAMEELFDQFRPPFLANAAYRFRNRNQFLADLGPRSPVADVGPGPRAAAPQLGAFLEALLPDGEPGRPGRKAGAAHGRHDAYGLHQCSGGGRGQGARCTAISLGGDRAGRALRNAASWDIGSVGR